MPRASVYLLDGLTYHLTHRCHNRDRHLRFAHDRDVYRGWLREGVKRHRVPVYAYCITHNHVHVVARADSAEAVSAFMHLAAGSTAKQYNLRRKHEGSLWEHPFHCTAIENGRHLLNCMVYVDLNMVRAGVVKHPRDWPWCSYGELTGARTRYRMLSLDRILESLEVASLDQFRRLYVDAVEARLATGALSREAHWSESLAVGSQGFVAHAEEWYPRRMYLDRTPVSPVAPEVWMVRERDPGYTVDRGTENSL